MAATEAAYLAWWERTRARRKAYQARYYQVNRERLRKQQNAVSRSGMHHSVYRRIVISLLLQRDGANCGICGLALGSDFSIDHITPRRLGGGEEAGNIRLTHRKCNHERPRGHVKWRGKAFTNV